MSRALLLTLFAVAVGGGNAQAQPSPAVFDAAKEMVGGWELSNADHDRRCTVTFSMDPAPGGFKLALDQGCATVFPMFKDVTIWSIVPNGPLRLLDPKGNTTLEMSEVESGIFEGERRGEGLYFMQPQGAATIPVRTPEQMFGDWNFLREIDKPLCALTLLRPTVAATDYKLTVKPGLRRRDCGFRPLDLAARGRPARIHWPRRLVAICGKRYQYLGAHSAQHQSAADAQAIETIYRAFSGEVRTGLDSVRIRCSVRKHDLTKRTFLGNLLP